jgi:hypothetical protein
MNGDSDDFSVHLFLVRLFFCSLELPLIQLHRILISQINRIAYQCMADAYFVEEGDLLGKELEVV